MEKDFRLEVVTPEKVVFDDRVTSLVLPAADGLMGVLPNHAPIVAALDVGELTIKDASGRTRRLMISDGFLEMADNHARILADAGERAEDIDVERAREAEQRARDLLAERGRREDIDFARAERALQRALWRLRVARRDHGR